MWDRIIIKNTASKLTHLNLILKILDSDLDREVSDLLAFISPSKQMLVQYLKIGHN
jgi:hypothetical protein